MHRIDKQELLETLAALRREANLLVAEVASADQLTRARRISLLLRYMTEHLEMLASPRASGDLSQSEPRAKSRARRVTLPS
jgi:hypothetical protein